MFSVNSVWNSRGIFRGNSKGIFSVELCVEL